VKTGRFMELLLTEAGLSIVECSVSLKGRRNEELDMSENCCGHASEEPKTIQLKTEYVGKMESKLAELGAKIDELTIKAGEAKDQAAIKVEELKRRKEEATRKFQQLQSSSGDAWQEFKLGLDKAVEDMKQALHELKSGSEKAAAKFSQ
jgi:hypothetical protein